MTPRVAALPVDLLSLSNALEGCALTIEGAARRLGVGRADHHSTTVASLARTARSVEVCASGYAYCQYGRDAAYTRGELFSRPRPGDVFFHFRRGDRGAGHTGIVVDVLPDGQVLTIEGNAGPRSGRDGGGVVKQTRSLAYSKGLTFWRVFPPSPDDDRGPRDLALRPSTLEPQRRRTDVDRLRLRSADR